MRTGEGEEKHKRESLNHVCSRQVLQLSEGEASAPSLGGELMQATQRALCECCT